MSTKKQQSVVTLDPIERNRKRQNSPFCRLLKSRWSGGKTPHSEIPFGHYLFCGSQGSGKTASALWYSNYLQRKYRTYRDPKDKKVHRIKWEIYSNIGFGKDTSLSTCVETFLSFKPREDDPYTFHLIILDEIQSFYGRDVMSKEAKFQLTKLIGIFCQLRKRNTFVLSTAQVYGRLDKSLREQCLFMVSCRKSFTGRLVNDFIAGDDIICDEMGRWSGIPKRIYVHGLSKIKYETSRIIQD